MTCRNNGFGYIPLTETLPPINRSGEDWRMVRTAIRTSLRTAILMISAWGAVICTVAYVIGVL